MSSRTSLPETIDQLIALSNQNSQDTTIDWLFAGSSLSIYKGKQIWDHVIIQDSPNKYWTLEKALELIKDYMKSNNGLKIRIHLRESKLGELIRSMP